MRSVRAWGVLALMLVHGAVLALQQLGMGPPWLAELTRFFPWYWLLVPCVLAVLLALGLSRWLLATAVVNLLLMATLTMGLQWRLMPMDASPPGTTLRVVSYNIKALNARETVDGFDNINREVRLHAPDIVALQDAQNMLPLENEEAITVAAPLFGLPHVRALGQYVIASRYPVRSCSTGKMGPLVKPEPQVYLHCQLDIEGKTLEVVTAHFLSPRSALMETRRGVMEGINDWIDNLRARYSEAQKLLQAVSPMPRPLLVLGDLNAPEGSLVLAELMRAGLRDTFAEAGRGYGYTYGHALSRKTDFLRIDHILVSSGMSVLSSTVGGEEASDHSPVVAEIKLHR
jgi:endonuclease/exonuclease/phosphatase family metal-dependent hydrolase